MNLDFSDIKVLLIGDFMIDHYIIGTSKRMSPESSQVPVVLPKEEYSIPGGAGNVAMNMCVFAGQKSYRDNMYFEGKPFIFCVGAVGHDKMGNKLLSILNGGIIRKDFESMGTIEFIHYHDQIDTSNIIKGDLPMYDSMDPRSIYDKFRGYIETTVKERTYLNGKQIYRVDRERLLNQSYNEDLNNLITKNIIGKDIVVLSDYNKGVLNEVTIPHILSEAKKNKIPVIIDPKKDDFTIYEGADILTPNLNELNRASKTDINDEKSIIEACNKLIEKHNFNFIVAKKGKSGITIVGKNNFVKQIQAHAIDNPDVTGAGDTVIASFSLAYAKLGDVELAAKIANAAASIAVSKKGTAVVETKEIESLFTK